MNLKLPLTKNIKRTRNAHVFNISSKNNRPKFLGQRINQHEICVHMICHYEIVFHKISNSQVLQLQVLRSSRRLIILCIKHNNIVIKKKIFSDLAIESTMRSLVTRFLNQTTWVLSTKQAMNFACIVKEWTRVCFLLFQDIAPQSS